MFPEWARKGNREEGLRVHKLHQQIAASEPVCVAPIGLAWEVMRTVDSSLRMHAADGNHASLNGTLLTAFVFYEIITSQLAANLPYEPEIRVSADVQKKLRDIASRTLQNHPPCSLRAYDPGHFDSSGFATEALASFFSCEVASLSSSSLKRGFP